MNVAIYQSFISILSRYLTSCFTVKQFVCRESFASVIFCYKKDTNCLLCYICGMDRISIMLRGMTESPRWFYLIFDRLHGDTAATSMHGWNKFLSQPNRERNATLRRRLSSDCNKSSHADRRIISPFYVIFNPKRNQIFYDETIDFQIISCSFKSWSSVIGNIVAIMWNKPKINIIIEWRIWRWQIDFQKKGRSRSSGRSVLTRPFSDNGYYITKPRRLWPPLC